MKAIKSTIGTTHPLVSPEDLSVIFYKIPDLHSIHTQFVEGLKKLQSQDDPSSKTSSSERIYEETPSLGDLFKSLASRLGAYSAYLKNYSRALETVQKCSSESSQFSEITRVSHEIFHSLQSFDYFLNLFLCFSLVIQFPHLSRYSLPEGMFSFLLSLFASQSATELNSIFALNSFSFFLS